MTRLTQWDMVIGRLVICIAIAVHSYFIAMVHVRHSDGDDEIDDDMLEDSEE